MFLSRGIPRVLHRSLLNNSRLLHSTPTEIKPTTETKPIETPPAEAENTDATPIDLPENFVTVEAGQAIESDFFENLHTEALKLKSKDTKQLDNELYEIITGETTTPLTKKLSQNQDLVKELKAFVEEFTLDISKHRIRTQTKRTLDSNKFSNLEPSLAQEPYTSQELFLRKTFRNNSFLKTGSNLKDVYIPHQDVFQPPKNLSIAKLLASGAHLGHSKSLFRSSNQQFIYGEYKGIHIIDLEKTLTYLKKASKIIEGVAQQGGIILYVGTREGQERPLEVAAGRSGGFYVSNKWIAGTLTNSTEISTWERHEVDLSDKPTGRELTQSESKRIVKPDLIVVLNPTENRVLLNEAIQTRVPTIGIIDTDSEASLVTYPIPANDDSNRATTLILGVLSKAAEIGYKTRLRDFEKYSNSRNQLSV